MLPRTDKERVTMTENQQVINQPDKNIFGSEASFRAKLEEIAMSEVAPIDSFVEETTTDSTRPQAPIVQEVPEALGHEETIDNSDYEGQSENTDQEGKKSHMIPISRLNKESEKRRAVELQLEAEREAKRQFEAELAALKKYAIKPEIEVEHKPVAIDPLDEVAFKHHDNEIKALKSRLDEQTNFINQQVDNNKYLNTVNKQVSDFEASHPDYNDAANHLFNVEKSIMMRVLKDETKAIAAVNQKYQDLGRYTINNGDNLAESIYEMAKTYGYQGNNRSNTPRQPDTPNIAALQKNMAATRSTAGLGNNAALSPNNVELTVTDMLDKYGRVDQEAFHKKLAKITGNYSY